MWNLFTRFFKCRHLIWLSILCVAFAGCKDDFDDSELRDQIADLDGRLTSLEKLCAQMNTNISSMQTIVNALQQNDYITGVTPIMEGGNTIGYTITFMKNKPITIYHGKDGEKGEDGITPRFKIENSRWMVSRDNGNTWEDAGQATGDQGLPGVAGITPKLKIENGRWLISWDNGASWEDIGQATGDQGQQGTAGITPQFKIEFGNWFVSFDHGTNWSLLGQATGDKGEDGITPVIGIRQDTDGIYYWTLNGTWLLDDNNQKVKAEGTDGKDGKPGEDGTPGKDGNDGTPGTPGKDGITPLLKIEGGYWYVSYDNENSWKQLGKTTGESEGNFFQEITEDEDYVYITLTGNQTAISIPKYKPLSINFDEPEDICVHPNTSYFISYDLIGSDENITIKTIAQDGFHATVKKINHTRGVIEITTPDHVLESEVLVFVSDGKGHTIIRSINFFEGIINITTKNHYVGYEGGKIDVELTTNIEYIINIPEEAKTWLSIAPAARSSMRREVISFFAQLNATSAERSATIHLIDKHGKYSESILITQQRGIVKNVFHVAIPGTLSQFVPTEDINLIEEITITGSLNKADYDFINTLSILKHVNLSGLTDVTIPPHAFNDSKISSIILPSELIEIGDMAFHYSKIATIDIPPTVKKIGIGAFSESYITSLIIPNSVEHIGGSAFADTKKLRGNITIPNTTTFLGDRAFYGSGFDGTLTLGSGLKEIKPMTFQYCENATGNLIIPANIQKIGYWAFNHYGKKGSSNLGTLQIDAQLDSIPTGAFSSRHFTGKLVIPESVVYIGEYAFSGNPFTGDLIIPDKVEVIEERAFQQDYSNISGYYYDNLVLGTNLVFIGKNAFSAYDKFSYAGEKDRHYGLYFDKVQIKIADPNNLSWRYAFGENCDRKYNFEVPIGTISIYQELFKWYIKSIIEVEF